MKGCFVYRAGVMHAEGVDLRRVASAVGTPLYCYSKAGFERNYRAFETAFAGIAHRICYAMKANSNQAVLSILAQQGAGMDVVSGGELERALAVGVPGERIVFSGVGKTRDEMAAALDADILCFNVESEPELIALSGVARSKGKEARVSIRVNPGIDSGTHTKIATGTLDSKFGIPIRRASQVYESIDTLPFLSAIGVDMHIGSQILEMDSFRRAAALATDLARQLMGKGHQLRYLDLGGGLGVPYQGHSPFIPHLQLYAETIKRSVMGLDLDLILEPGRAIAGNAGVLLTRVLYVKYGEEKVFVIVDAGMNDLIRPTLYGAYHEIKPVALPDESAPRIVADVVGPVCETGDFLALDRQLVVPQPGDLLVVMMAGAYGAVGGSNYNSRPLAPEVLVHGDRFAVVRPRETYRDLLSRDSLPDWLPSST